mgnify:CR=1 FL=1
MTDARFEDAAGTPLNLGAMDADDLLILSSLAQDAVFRTADMSWAPARARFSVLLGRFRWEDGQRKERVRTLLCFDGVQSVASAGLDRDDKDAALSLLAIDFDPDDAPAGDVVLTLSGGGAIRLRVEALEATLKDVTKPYAAPSRRTPTHLD